MLAFPEYLGHAVGWENLLEAAAEPEDDDNEPDPGGLVVAVEQIRKTTRKLAKGWYEEEYDEEEDEEEEEEDWLEDPTADGSLKLDCESIFSIE